MPEKLIGIVCGLQSEAAAVRKACSDKRILIGVSGASAVRAEEIAREFCEAGVCVLLSVGVSGGLDPVCKPGDTLIGESVVTAEGKRYACDGTLLQDVLSYPRPWWADGFNRSVLLFGSDVIVANSEEKARLFSQTNAVAVDMESHAVARAAQATGVSFLAIRAVADPFDRALPSAAVNAVAPDGSTRVFQTLGMALRDPKQFPALIRLGTDSATALKTLRLELSRFLARLFGVLEN